MDNVIESIRAAIVCDATPEAKSAGIAACRAVLSALEGTPGQPLAAPATASPVAALVGALRGVPPDQLLDLAIAKLRAALPADANIPAATPLKFHLIPLPKPGGTP
jgi:hypothetical protein